MSLTSHLANPSSPIGQFIKQRFSQSKNLTKEANRQLATVNTSRPGGQGYPYGNIGTAIDYRIRYLFAHTPYQQLVAWHSALLLTYKPRNRENDVPVPLQDRAIIRRYLPIESWNVVAQGPYSLGLLQAFFDSLEAFLNTVRPEKQHLDSANERILARYCYTLTLFEQTYRAGREIVYRGSPLMNPTPKRSVEELLAIAPEACVEDICQLSTLFYDHFQNLLMQPALLNPKFAGSLDIGGADADLVVNGCLIDIKASVEAKIKQDYLHQLIGYILLDYDNALRMNATGIYMARQGMLFTWPLQEFLQQLTGDNRANLPSLREEFRSILQTESKHNR